MQPQVFEKVSRAVEAGLFEEHESGILLPGLGLVVGGVFSHELIRNGKSLGVFHDHNRIVDEGLDYILETALGAGVAVGGLYVGIFSGAGYVPAADDDNTNIVSRSTEIVAGYDGARPAWQKSGGGLPDASGQSISNSTSKASFVFVAAVSDVEGAFLSSASAKSSVSGSDYLIASSKFSIARTVAIDDELLITYTLTAQTAP